MSKIIFVGDTHLKATAPISRKDNYPETILNKIKFIWEYASSIECENIIFLGDIFDTVNTSLQYFSGCLSLFKQISDNGVSLYTIVGNHDLKYDSMETLPVTPLGILVKSGAIHILDSLTIDDVCITGCHFPINPEKNKNADTIYSILLLHRFYDSGFNEVPITKEDVIQLNYDAYILGHDHKPYKTVYVENNRKVPVIRPGSLARNSSEQYNKLRKPRILIFDTDKKKFEYEEIPSASSKDIFIEREEETNVVSMKELVEYLQSSYDTSDTSIRGYIEETAIPDDVKALIKNYLNILGA